MSNAGARKSSCGKPSNCVTFLLVLLFSSEGFAFISIFPERLSVRRPHGSQQGVSSEVESNEWDIEDDPPRPALPDDPLVKPVSAHSIIDAIPVWRELPVINDSVLNLTNAKFAVAKVQPEKWLDQFWEPSISEAVAVDSIPSSASAGSATGIHAFLTRQASRLRRKAEKKTIIGAISTTPRLFIGDFSENPRKMASDFSEIDWKELLAKTYGNPSSQAPTYQPPFQSLSTSSAGGVSLDITPGGGDVRDEETELAGKGTDSILFPVHFCTNREIETIAGTQIQLLNEDRPEYWRFTNKRSRTLTYGKTFVRILKYHDMPGKPPPSFREKLWRCDFRNNFETMATTRLGHKQFGAEVDQKEGEDALLFIHGYSTDFEGAATRAAQLGFDLKIGGMTAFFSWPTKGRKLSYIVDEATISASERSLSHFLVDFSKRVGRGKANIIAHSMGNRGLLGALQRIRRMPQAKDIMFGQVIFAAPDEDRDAFCDAVEEFVGKGNEPNLATRFTLYASNHDNAVWTSRLLHQAPRAGYWKPYTEVNGVDTIAADVDSDFMGHSYFAEARPVLTDIKLLLDENKHPKKRGFGLHHVEGFQSVWSLR